MPPLMPSPGNPVVPMPLCGRRVRLPRNTLTEHLADFSDPHDVKAILPDCRFGAGAPAVLPGDKPKDFYLDTSSSCLYVMRASGTSKVWVLVSGAGGGGGGSSPEAAVDKAVEISETDVSEVSEMTGDDKDALLVRLAQYVVAKEGLS